MSKVLVVYYSSTGNTESMAQAVSEGAKLQGAEVELVSVSDAASKDVNSYDAYALGCSAMGDEQLEEAEFEPFFQGLLPNLADKKVTLFGSYGWGDGKWMRDWVETCKQANVNLVNDGLIINESPDEDGLSKCKELGKLLA